MCAHCNIIHIGKNRTRKKLSHTKSKLNWKIKYIQCTNVYTHVLIVIQTNKNHPHWHYPIKELLYKHQNNYQTRKLHYNLIPGNGCIIFKLQIIAADTIIQTTKHNTRHYFAQFISYTQGKILQTLLVDLVSIPLKAIYFRALNFISHIKLIPALQQASPQFQVRNGKSTKISLQFPQHPPLNFE
jgi:hypothetical protein